MPQTAEINGNFPPQVKSFARAAAVLSLFFALPLFRLARFAAGDELHSYILLIPVVCLYLAWLEKNHLPPATTPAVKSGLAFFVGGLAVIAWHWLFPAPTAADSLAQSTLAYVLLLAGAGFFTLGRSLMRKLAFPFSLLIFMVPLPDFLREQLETGLQHGSAVVAGWMFAVSDVPVLQDNLTFRLPNINLHVAPECSGIHSTMVLFITSLVAGKLFLEQSWTRAVLCLAVIPLALVRNAFRIFVLGELCTHIGPQMIDSPVHHHGGPLFFALSLVPFLLLLYCLKKYGHRKTGRLPKMI
jgi:exosortase C (VPDSG-CTERM-specific)